MKLLEEVTVTLRPKRYLQYTEVRVEVKGSGVIIAKHELITEQSDFVPFFEFLMERATKLLLHYARNERGERLDGTLT